MNIHATLLTTTAAIVFASGCRTVLPVATYPARAQADSLRVAVVAQNEEGKGDAISTAAASATRKALVEKGFRVEDSDSPDVRVSLDVSHREVNRAGDFILMEGQVVARATVPARENRVLGDELIKARAQRALGESAAIDELTKALVPQVTDWASRSISVSATGVRAQTVVISYAKASAKRLPEFKTKFVTAVLSTTGVRSCVLVSENAVPPTAEFRVVYDEGAFPAGLVNEIAVRHPELNLRPGAPF
ncbi:MAG: hypothetical protein ILM98_05950 [Kiritimatiellae bacterium]|nr:hypothetical protein [Kiritimatiellia bacterium]